MSTADQLHAILERHCTVLPDEVASAGEKFAEAVLSPTRYRHLVRDVIEIVHRINGSSGSLGFRDLSATAAKLEGALNKSAQTGTTPDDVQIRRLYGLLEEMRALVAKTQPEDSQIYGLDISRLR